ncbi:MAG: hypothetical protein HKN26_06485, partial [Acidimicrobiales bacterium]|nr:hypothetical protein [Acidimicrobiales bacterium]
APTSTTTPATTVTGLGLPPGTRFTIDETRPDVPVLVMSRFRGGFVDQASFYNQSADYVVYPDGLVLFNVGDWSQTARYEAGRLDVETLATALDEATNAGVLEPDVEFGEPGITDMGDAVVIVNEAGRATRTVSAYALEFSDQDDILPDKGVARAALRELFDTVDTYERLDGAPEDPDGARGPDRYVVRALTAFDDEGDGAAADWPLDAELAPDIEGCVELTPAQFAEIAPTVLDAESNTTDWTVDGTAVRLTFAPRFPTEPGCTI